MQPTPCARNRVFSGLTGAGPRVPELVMLGVLSAEARASPAPARPTWILSVTAPSEPLPQTLPPLASQPSPHSPSSSPVHPLCFCKADTALPSLSMAMLIKGPPLVVNHVYRNVGMLQSRQAGSRASICTSSSHGHTRTQIQSWHLPFDPMSTKRPFLSLHRTEPADITYLLDLKHARRVLCW